MKVITFGIFKISKTIFKFVVYNNMRSYRNRFNLKKFWIEKPERNNMLNVFFKCRMTYLILKKEKVVRFLIILQLSKTVFCLSLNRISTERVSDGCMEGKTSFFWIAVGERFSDSGESGREFKFIIKYVYLFTGHWNFSFKQKVCQYHLPLIILR